MSSYPLFESALGWAGLPDLRTYCEGRIRNEEGRREGRGGAKHPRLPPEGRVSMDD